MARRVASARFLLLLGLALPVAAPASAEERIDRLRSQIQQGLDDMGGQLGPEVRIERKGTLVMTQQGDEISATLPEITLIADFGRVTLPSTTTKFRPAGPDSEAFSGTLPQTITIVPDSGTPAELTIGSQTVEGTYNLKAKVYETLDVRLGGIFLGEKGSQPIVQIQDLTMNGGLQEREPGLWSGAYKGALSRITAANPAGGEGAAIGAIEFEATYDAVRMLEIVKRTDLLAKLLNDQTTALASAVPPPSTGAVKKPDTKPGAKPGAKADAKPAAKPAAKVAAKPIDKFEETRQEMIALRKALDIAGDVTDLARGLGVRMVVREVAVTDGQGKEAFGLGRFGLSEGLHGSGNGLAEMGFTLDLAGLRLGESIRPSADPRLIPADLLLDISFDRIPAAGLWTAMRGHLIETLDAEIAKPKPKPVAKKKPKKGEPAEEPVEPPNPLEDAVTMAMFATLGDAMPLFETAKPRLRLKSGALSSDLLTVEASGESVYEPAATLSSAGKADIVLTGLDQTIDTLTKAEPDSAQPELLAGLVGVRGMAKGAPAPASDGRSKHLLTLELTPDGKFLANGIDLGTMGGLLPGGPAETDTLDSP